MQVRLGAACTYDGVAIDAELVGGGFDAPHAAARCAVGPSSASKSRGARKIRLSLLEARRMTQFLGRRSDTLPSRHSPGRGQVLRARPASVTRAFDDTRASAAQAIPSYA